jgi:PPOX class probable F420-dependent enzyme
MMNSFDTLEKHRYANLTTFRRTGEGVKTPVWFAVVNGAAYVFTGRDSGKVKRIRNDPRVDLAPSDVRGRVKGASLEATARILQPSEEAFAEGALREKYTWQYRGFNLLLRLLRNAGEHVFLELRPSGED